MRTSHKMSHSFNSLTQELKNLFPVNICKLFLDINLFNFEVFAEQSPSHIKHFCSVKVNVNSEQLVCIFLSKIKAALTDAGFKIWD